MNDKVEMVSQMSSLLPENSWSESQIIYLESKNVSEREYISKHDLM